MELTISTYEQLVATVTLVAGVPADEIELDDATRVSLDADGNLISLELDSPAARFGDPFDQAAAARAVAWAREQLAGGTAG